MEDVRKSYGDVRALDGVTLSFREGATTAVVGPSASGKSTLLQLVNGLERPGEGAVEVLGEPVDYDALPAHRLRCGYAVQGTGLFPHMTVLENISLLARVRGWAQDRWQARALRLLALVGLDEALGPRYPHELSGGQRQRVGLCRALVLEPPILLLDEAFGALDPITRREVHVEFLRLREAEPATVLLVTHDLREAVHLADDLVVLRQGRVVQHAACDEVVESPADDFVRRLVTEQLAP